MASQFPNVKAVFDHALEIKSAGERQAYLDKIGAVAPEVRRQVEVLLRAHEAASGFLEESVVFPDDSAITHALPPESTGGRDADAVAVEEFGGRIGPYRLLRLLGEGGMGTVWMVEQEHPVRRRVALKVIKLGMDTAQVIARFDAERQALAMMDHANIARVLDAGSSPEGRPFFVMELIQGVPITRYCDDNRVGLRERLHLFIQVCQAIQHAHTKGIIHRDIKPSNVLVTINEGTAVPKVIDFGIAKATEQRLTDRTLLTQEGSVIGTFEYMSPEQAEISALGVDTRSDIFSLGVLLYELLTGSTPLDREKLKQAGFTEKLRMIKEEEPRQPSARLLSLGFLPAVAAARRTEPGKLPRLLRGELDWIVMKCLEKDRTRRYETAHELALDVRRYLDDEAILARPPSTGYRLRKFLWRNKGPVLAAGAFVLLLLVSVVVSVLLTFQAQAEARNAEIERDRAQRVLVDRVAQQLEGDIMQLVVLGHAIEDAVKHFRGMKKEELEKYLRNMLEREKRIYSLCVAFEPSRFEKERENYCPCVFRDGKDPDSKLQFQDLLPPDYPLYRNWKWYEAPRDAGRPLWFGPGSDVGGAVTISYCLPFNLDGKFAGVITVDLEVGYFNQVRGWLADLNPGQKRKSYGFIISGKETFDGKGDQLDGTLIGHPGYDEHSTKITDLASDDEFTKLAQRMLKGEPGKGEATDPWTRKRSTFLFAPVLSAKWIFVAVIE